MAEVVRPIVSATAIGDVAARAAQLSLALFAVHQTFKSVPQEIAQIAEGISSLSGSLLTLAELMDAHQHLCKPALFQNTKTILLRYNQVDAELRQLIDTPQKLSRLKWCVKRPKARGLLKKVEGITSAFTLQINIIRVAREEIIRSQTDHTSAGHALHRPNRFRNIVESDVQANRQVVESAQRADAESSTWQRKSFGKELNIWTEGSFDTATWLYHLVFSPLVPDPPAPPIVARQLRYQASVSDESAEHAEDLSHGLSELSIVPNSEPSVAADKTMIVWGTQTEPSAVVDRLLLSWTTLTGDQISQSSQRKNESEWRTFLKMVEEAKEEEEAELSRYEKGKGHDTSGSSEDEYYFLSAENESETEPTPKGYRYPNPFPTAPPIHTNKRSPKPKGSNSPVLTSTDEWEKPNSRTKQNSKRNRTYVTHRPVLQRVRWQEDTTPIEHTWKSSPYAGASTAQRYASSRSQSSASQPSQIYTIYSASDQSYTPYDGNIEPEPHDGPVPIQAPRYNVSDPYGSSHEPRSSSTFPSKPFASQPLPGRPATSRWPTSTPNRPPMYPPPDSTGPLRSSPTNAQQQSAASTALSKEDAVIAAIGKLLDTRTSEPKADFEDPRVSKIMQLLVEQQEHQDKFEKATAKAVADAELQQAQAAREIEQAKIQRLEDLILQQSKEQEKAQAAWRAEKMALDEKATKQAEEAKELARKEIAAAHAAKKAAKKSLKVAKAQAEERAQEEAEARAKEEWKTIEEDYKRRMERYEKLMEANSKTERPQPQPIGPLPVRRTCITEGNRSVEVAEYTTENLNPFANAPFSPFRFSQEEIFGLSNDQNRSTDRFRHDSFHGLAATMRSSNTSLSNVSTTSTTKNNNQGILLPSRIDRNSPKTLKLQAGLEESGIDTVFDEAETTKLVRHDGRNEDLVRSTIFWEPPMLRFGSDLLFTMRKAGWKPLYSRCSDAGQTFFLGSQPIHSYIFSPDYKPQFTALSASPSSQFVIVSSGLVEEDAMEQLGFRYRSDDTGAYILDGRLTASDIEDLVERSFSMRETYFRRLHRQLQWHHDSSPGVETPTDKGFAPSVRSGTSVSETQTCTPCPDTDLKRRSPSSDVHQVDRLGVERFRIPDSDEDDLPSMRRGSTSTESPSIESWSSKSTNPFRRHTTKAKKTADVSDSARSMTTSIWDDPMLL